MTNAPISAPRDVAAPAGERRAADDDGGDRVELERLAGLRRGGGQLGGDDEPGHRGAEAADHVDAQLDALDRDAGELGGALVAADRVDPAAERRLAGEERRDGREQRPSARSRPGSPSDLAAAELLEAGVAELRAAAEVGVGLAVGDQQGDAAGDVEHAERGDERGDAEARSRASR